MDLGARGTGERGAAAEGRWCRWLLVESSMVDWLEVDWYVVEVSELLPEDVMEPKVGLQVDVG